MALHRIPAGLWKNLLAIQVYGANTGVGKTVLSTLLGVHFNNIHKSKGDSLGRPRRWNVAYIKPVSTGPSTDMDARSVFQLRIHCAARTHQKVSYVNRHMTSYVSTLFKFDEPVSPHVAARLASEKGKFVVSYPTYCHRLHR